MSTRPQVWAGRTSSGLRGAKFQSKGITEKIKLSHVLEDLLCAQHKLTGHEEWQPFLHTSTRCSNHCPTFPPISAPLRSSSCFLSFILQLTNTTIIFLF